MLAGAGRQIRVAERTDALGGALALAAVGPGRERLRRLTDWLAAECTRLGVEVALGVTVDARAVRAAQAEGWEVVLATGSRPFPDRYPGAGGGPPVIDALSLLRGAPACWPDGPVVVDDPVGGPVGIGVAGMAGLSTERAVTLVSPDPVAGTLLARTGDLADANVRLQRAGVTRQLRARITTVAGGAVARRRRVDRRDLRPARRLLVDCGHRLPDEDLYRALGDPTLAGCRRLCRPPNRPRGHPGRPAGGGGAARCAAAETQPGRVARVSAAGSTGSCSRRCGSVR